MKATLAAHGHEVFDVGYPSTRRSIDEHTAQVSRLLDRAEGAREVSFVTHSLGGIVVRQLLAKKRPWQQRIRAKRVVMLGPPNRGSVIAKKVRRSSAVRLVLGASISQLTAAQVAKIPAPPIPFAVIAGGKGDGSGYNPLLDGDDDGVVTVANTKLDGMADFRLLRCLHTSLMNHDRALALVRDFLEKGSFGTR
jgi:pimeloyl-ACP methyl ester carboxylesterase